MNRGYTKLFSTIVTSSMWSEDSDTRIVWVTMLALADQYGEVMASVPGLARTSNVPLDACKIALEKFLSPDEYSRTDANEGRRIEAIEGGWRLLNYELYREKMSLDERREYKRIKESERREKLKNDQNSRGHGVDKRGHGVDKIRQTQTETKTQTSDTDTKEERGKSFSLLEVEPQTRKGTVEELTAFCKSIGLDESDGMKTFLKWEANGWTVNGKPIKSWKATIRSWQAHGYMPSQKDLAMQSVKPKTIYTRQEYENARQSLTYADEKDKATRRKEVNVIADAMGWPRS